MNRSYTLLALQLVAITLAGLLSACSASSDSSREAARPTAAPSEKPSAAATQPVTAPTAVPTQAAGRIAEPFDNAPAPTKPARRVRKQPAVAVVSLTSGRVKAAVWIDGKARGPSPRRVRLAPGAHKVMLKAKAYVPVARVIRLKPGQRVRLALRLRPAPAPLIVRTGNHKTGVAVDGKILGRTPLKKDVRPGRHTVVLSRKGYYSWKKRISLRPGATRALRVKLPPRKARLDIGSTPNGAQVLIDRKWRGRTDRVIYRVKPGFHTVTVTRRGFKRFVKRVRFGPGGQITVRHRLERAAPPVLGSSAPLRHRPLAVMIENHPDARPQSGLDFADVVLEAPAEGGISRFIAFFITHDVSVVGPVRSAREYFVQWAKEFNPLYFHAGGSPGAAALADRIGLTRTNALWDGRAFYRTTDRYAPHNLYTSTGALLRAERSKGRGTKSGTWGGLRFKKPGTFLGPRRASYMNIHFNSYYYAEWRWAPSAGVYRRWMQGEPAIERNTGRQITATAVIVRIHDIHRIPGDEKAREDIQVFGSGRAYIFQDGRVTRATWRKEDNNSPTMYYDSRGRQLAVNKGGVWIQAIPQYGGMRFR